MPQPFLDISFPPFVARGATGGPGFMTTVVTLGSGAEQRNILWEAKPVSKALDQDEGTSDMFIASRRHRYTGVISLRPRWAQ